MILLMVLTTFSVWFSVQLSIGFYSPGLDAETVLDKDSDEEEDDALDGHGKQVLPHHVPGQRGAEPVLTCRRTNKQNQCDERRN